MEAAVHANPGLRNRAARMGGGTVQATHTHAVGGFDMDGSRASWVSGTHLMPFPWMAYGNASQPGKTCRRSWQEHTRISVHVLRVLNSAMGEHRPNPESATPNSLLRVIKLWYFMPARLHSPDGIIKRRQRFALVESGDTVFLLPWLIVYTRRSKKRQRDAAHDASEEAKLERASSVCRHAGGVKVATHTLLAEPNSAGSEETWSTSVAKFPSED